VHHELLAIELLLEEGPPPAPGAPSSSGTPGANGARCPRGSHKDPNTGKCVPREQLKLQYRGHEPNAAMHREKSAGFAAQAQQHRMNGDHDKADKAEKLSAKHMERAKWHNAQMHAVGKVLYPNKYRKGASMGAPGTDKHAREIPMVKPPRGAYFGAQHWGNGGHGGNAGGAAGRSGYSASAGYSPFGNQGPSPSPSPSPKPPPRQGQGASGGPGAPHHDPTQVDPPGHGPTQPDAKPQGLVHKIGHALGHGLKTAALHKSMAAGGHLGWATLAHGLDALLGGSPTQPVDTGHAPTLPQGHPAAAPTQHGGATKPPKKPKLPQTRVSND